MTYAEVFAAVLAVVLAVCVVAVLASVVVIAATLVASGYASGEVCEALSRWRRLRTPACSSCRWCVHGDWGLHRCACPTYLDHLELLECSRRESASPDAVRGTRWCRWEERPEAAEDTEEEGI